MKKAILLGAILFLSASGMAKEKAFQGTIHFDVKGEDPVTMVQQVGKNKMRMELTHEEQGLVSASIVSDKRMIVLMPRMNMYMEMPLDDDKVKKKTKKGDDVEYEFVRTGKKKKILGYSCEEVAVRGKDADSAFWVTDELGGFGFGAKHTMMNMPGLKGAGPNRAGPPSGLPLETWVDGKLLMKATKVETKAPPASAFEIPKGYKKMPGGGFFGAMMGDEE